jgi:hypothetical protein
LDQISPIQAIEITPEMLIESDLCSPDSDDSLDLGKLENGRTDSNTSELSCAGAQGIFSRKDPADEALISAASGLEHIDRFNFRKAV